MTALDWAAKLAQDNGEEIYDSFLSAIKSGEWRAAVAVMDRIYGRPTDRVETVELTEKPIEDLSLAELKEERRRLLAENPGSV